MGLFSWQCMTKVIAIFDVLIDCFYLALWFGIVLLVYGIKFMLKIFDVHFETQKGWAILSFLLILFMFAIGILLFMSGRDKCLAVNVKRCFIFVAVWVCYNTFWFFYVIYITFFKENPGGKGTGVFILIIKAAFMGPVIMYGLELRQKLQQVRFQPTPGDTEAGNPEDPEAPIPKHQQAAAEEEKS